jgi:hypothetical protein
VDSLCQLGVNERHTVIRFFFRLALGNDASATARAKQIGRRSRTFVVPSLYPKIHEGCIHLRAEPWKKKSTY